MYATRGSAATLPRRFRILTYMEMESNSCNAA